MEASMFILCSSSVKVDSISNVQIFNWIRLCKKIS